LDRCVPNSAVLASVTFLRAVSSLYS
jgi:hypothetical protein